MGRKARGWLLAVSLFGCLTAHAGSPVWAIHGDHNTVYLAGSVHLLKAKEAALPTAFDRAYMNRLYQVGRQQMLSGKAWSKYPPGYNPTPFSQLKTVAPPS